MDKNFKIYQLWPIPVYEAIIPPKKEWQDTTLNLEYVRTHVNNSDISKDRNIFENEESLFDLKKEILLHCDNFVRKFLNVKDNAQFYFTNSWSNIHKPKESSQIHYHGGSLISGVYYPIYPDNSGNIAFHKSHIWTNLFHQTIRFEYDEVDNITAEKYVINLDEGIIVLFPSHLEHSVEENLSNNNRYSIAFNLFVKGKFGKEEYELELK